MGHVATHQAAKRLRGFWKLLKEFNRILSLCKHLHQTHHETCSQIVPAHTITTYIPMEVYNSQYRQALHPTAASIGPSVWRRIQGMIKGIGYSLQGVMHALRSSRGRRSQSRRRRRPGDPTHRLSMLNMLNPSLEQPTPMSEGCLSSWKMCSATREGGSTVR